MHLQIVLLYVVLDVMIRCECATVKHESKPLVETNVRVSVDSDSGNWTARLPDMKVNIEHSNNGEHANTDHTWIMGISRLSYGNDHENNIATRNIKEDKEHVRPETPLLDENEEWNSSEDVVIIDPQNYEWFKGVGWFKLDSRNLTWPEAREACEETGGFLASPNTKSRAQVFRRLFERHPEIPSSAVRSHQVYVGVNDLDHDGIFTTVTGEVFNPSFLIWAGGKPNNTPWRRPPGADCITLHVPGMIGVSPCFYPLPFFCEKIIPIVL